MKASPRIETELGTERLCLRCQEWWPVDDEFWYFRKRDGGILGWCRACWSERNRDLHTKRRVAA